MILPRRPAAPEVVVSGGLEETPQGPILVARRRYPLDYRHGSVPLGDFLEASPEVLGLLGKSHEGGSRPDRLLYLDIETTGGPPESGEVTVVGLYADGVMTSLVRHQSLTPQRLQEILSRYDLLVTFCGSVFDVPYLRAKFPGLVLDQPHIDLCFAARRVGLRGGLKQIESSIGLERSPDLHGVDGWDAVRLWQASRRGSEDALELLLRYNEADTRNLLPLARLVYSRLAERYGPDGVADAASN